MTDLTPDEMLERIKRGLAENSARFHPKVIMVEGLNAWGTFHSGLLEKLAAHVWVQDNERWYPPHGMAFELAYEALCDVLPVVSGMSRDNMQPLMDGSYPDAEVWFEQYASYRELHRDGNALVIEPPRMSPVEHIGFLMRRAEQFYLIDANQIARELQDRADGIYLENGGATDGSLHWHARAELTEHLPQGRDSK